jgi:hypothetical protein
VLRTPPDTVADSDLALRLDALEEATRRRFDPDACRRWGLDAGAAREAIRARDQLLDAARRSLGPAPAPTAGVPEGVAVLRSLLAGFGDRVAQRRGPRSPRFKLAGGGGAVLAPTSVVREAELVLAVGLDAAAHGTGGEHRIQIASAVSLAWLPVVREVSTRWDTEREAVVQARVDRFLSLVLAEHPAGDAADPEAAAALLAREAARRPDRAFDAETVGPLEHVAVTPAGCGRPCRPPVGFRLPGRPPRKGAQALGRRSSATARSVGPGALGGRLDPSDLASASVTATSSKRSDVGRCQFSVLNAKSVRHSSPRRRAWRTVSRTASAPFSWPAVRGSPRPCAQRPLPSMMMATWRGMGSVWDGL